MCRMLAYSGPPVTLSRLILEPSHSLLKQSYAPRYQSVGTVNADGFGVGWYDLAASSEPGVYRNDKPIWSDHSFSSIARVISSGAIVAAVRDATPPGPVEVSSTAPFAAGTLLFAHNGALNGFFDGVNIEIRSMLSRNRGSQIRGSSDSEVLFAFVLDRIDEGASQADALRATIKACSRWGGRFNFLLHDGNGITATASGNSLFATKAAATIAEGTIIASEPLDDSAGWESIEDGYLVEASAGGFDVTELD
ncbi:MAG TPA: ergothioneine biosynthesis protein EgtC [Actinomycetota bacterium]|nr:ergothioneine biosynthesis protein EgtC [Actinomycetota bacterium]